MDETLVKKALIDCARHFLRGDRIGQLQKTGISDAELESFFRKDHAETTGYGGPGLLWMHCWVNENSCKVWIGETPSIQGKPTYEGKKLIAAVRQALDLPYADGSKQERLF